MHFFTGISSTFWWVAWWLARRRPSNFSSSNCGRRDSWASQPTSRRRGCISFAWKKTYVSTLCKQQLLERRESCYPGWDVQVNIQMWEHTNPCKWLPTAVSAAILLLFFFAFVWLSSVLCSSVFVCFPVSSGLVFCILLELMKWDTATHRKFVLKGEERTFFSEEIR